MPVTATAGATITVTRRPERALNPIRPAIAETKPRRGVFWADIESGYGMNP
jgi:hypothetical protein